MQIRGVISRLLGGQVAPHLGRGRKQAWNLGVLAVATSFAFASCSSPMPTEPAIPAMSAGSTVNIMRASSPALYVVNAYPPGVAIYRLPNRAPVRVVTAGFQCTAPVAVSLDAQGNLYVAHDYCGNDGITVYDPNGADVIRTITSGSLYPVSMSFDEEGSLYVANLLGPPFHIAGAVARYQAGRSSVHLLMTADVCAARSVVVDRRLNVYVASEYCGSSGAGSVAVFTAGGRRFDRAITSGITHPVQLYLDRALNLYVLNSQPPSVTVYALGRSIPKVVITKGVGLRGTRPTAIAVDSQGNLYVANAALTLPRGSISVYAPGQTSPERSIRDGIYGPSALAFDREGNLYVANAGNPGVTAGWISMYPPQQNRASLRITQGVRQPIALAVSDR